MSKNNWEFAYAGVDLPPPDKDGISFAIQPIDDAERTADGDMFIQPIATKHTINVRWSRLKGDENRRILNALHDNRQGVLRFYNPAKDSIDEMEVYYGAGASASFERYDDDLEKQRWSSVQVSFIEL